MSSTPRGAWIPIPTADELPAQVNHQIGDVSERIGFVPNIARLLAVTPSHFIGWWRYFDELTGAPSRGRRSWDC